MEILLLLSMNGLIWGLIATYESERDTLAPFRAKQSLESFGESYRHTSLGEIDQRYYSLGDHIYNLWAVFVKTRPELFAK